MFEPGYSAKPGSPGSGIDIVRVGVALIILMHPLHGFYYWQDLAPGFGGYLSSLGYPMGGVLAWLILLTQTACSLALLANRWVVPACLGHIVIVTFGIIHFHRPHGWYVTGPGEHGMEWGFILLVCLFGVLRAYWRRA
ncbi:MAG: DoxX family protein [Telluria sp.]